MSGRMDFEREGERRFTCDWIFKILVVLCDGNVVCGCADPYGERPLGHLNKNTLSEIWKSPLVKEIRTGLNRGYAPFCLNCGLKQEVEAGRPIPQRPVDLEILPRIFFEPTVLCNLSCFQAVCSKEAGILKTRKRMLFPFDEFKTFLEPIGKHLIRLDFFNYGEPFVHPQAADMVEYIKMNYPHIYLYTSTNGLLLDREKSRRIIASGLDEITFSVDGADQETYSRYRCGGDFQKLLSIMSDFVKMRNETGREVPFINWRCILFKWNDTRRHMKRVKKLAEKTGVDRLTWEITDHPPAAQSSLYQVGSPAWEKIYCEIWDSSQIGNALKKNRCLAKIKIAVREIRARTRKPMTVTAAVKNKGGALWRKHSFSGRRLVRLGAQLYSAEKNLLELNYARAFLPASLDGGQKTKIEIELPGLTDPGEFWLKFDMVSEGVDWFEAGGSQVLWKKFKVERI